MKLNLSQIRDITTGAVRIEEIDNNIHFYRFTKQQEDLYENRNAAFYQRTFATSGIQLRFRTDSQTIFLSVDTAIGSGRRYFSFEVFVNGEKIGNLNNFSEEERSADYTKPIFPLGNFSKKFCLGTGEKEVRVYFPWSVKATLKELIIDDGSFIKPVKPSKKMLCFGDSITQGYDTLYPFNKYITRLANMLDAEEHNKAIAGETFFPDLAASKDDFEPDYITVAYGTNDWNKCTKEAFTNNCKEFLCNLSNNYPNTNIFVITPIWRKDMNESRPFGDFKSVGQIIQEQAAEFGNILVIQGFEFIPQDENLFADLRLHPNDNGAEYYFGNLSKRIKDILQK
jgi:lysophospholipase L1-like esterase